MAAGNRSLEDETGGQNDLFAGAARTPPPIELRAAKPWVPTDRLSHEFEAVGFFLTGHPLDDYQEVLEALGADTWVDFAAKARTRRVVGTLAGTVLSARERQGKSGNAYAFVAFSDPTGQFEAVVFSEALAASRELLQPGSAVLLDVEAEADGETVKARVQRITSLEAAAEARHSGIKIYLEGTRALDTHRRAGRRPGRAGRAPARASSRRCRTRGRVRAAARHRRHAEAAERAQAGCRAWPRSAPSDRLELRGRSPCQEGVASL